MGRWTWKAVVFDESHKLTTSRSNKDPQQTKVCLALGRRAKRVVLLTGTPCLCRPFDLFNQVRPIDGGSELNMASAVDFPHDPCRWFHIASAVEVRTCSSLSLCGVRVMIRWTC